MLGVNIVTGIRLLTLRHVSAFNDSVMQTDQAQIFRAMIRVLAGACPPLDQRDVLILVPPQPIIIE